MLEKNAEVIEVYKNMTIYKKNNILHFGNKKYTNVRAKNVRSAKNLITRYIKTLSNKGIKSLKYLSYIKECLK